MSTQTAVEGTPVVIGCSAEGNPTPAITWEFLNETTGLFQVLQNGTYPHVKIVEVSLNNSRVDISGVERSGPKYFVCNATNPFGYSAAATNLTVHGKLHHLC